MSNGKTLKEIQLPDNARVVIIRRDSRFIVPDGQVELQSGDQLLMIYGEDESEELPSLKELKEKAKINMNKTIN